MKSITGDGADIEMLKPIINSKVMCIEHNVDSVLITFSNGYIMKIAHVTEVGLMILTRLST